MQHFPTPRGELLTSMTICGQITGTERKQEGKVNQPPQVYVYFSKKRKKHTHLKVGIYYN